MTYRTELRELAFESHGVVTVADAAAVGVPAIEVRKLASRGALTRIAQGVYRMNEVPVDPLSEFAAAVAMTGADAVLANEGVLAALDLAPINLRRIPVATSRRVRRNLPPTVNVIHEMVDPAERSDIDGIPAMSIPSAILGSRNSVSLSRLKAAANSALARGLIDPLELTTTIDALGEQ